jgi:large subunit ribosomal protein L15
MAIGIHELKPAVGSTHRRKRVGRGIGSGHGKTSTRGNKGNKARGQINPNFEGGQTPLHRRLPQVRGFKPVNKKVYALVNLNTLEARFEEGEEVTPEALIARGIVRDLHHGLKVLGDGELKKKLTVRAHKFSQSAQEKITAAGGTAETLAKEGK